MCMGGGGSPETDDRPFRLQRDNQREARAEEDAREARIAAGRSLLDAIFEGGRQQLYTHMPEAYRLNPGADLGDKQWGVAPAGGGEVREFEGVQPYLAQRERTLLDFYGPQLAEQFGDASDQLTYGLARAGQSRSTAGAEARGDLEQDFSMRDAEIRSKVAQDRQDTLAGFERSRSMLEDMLLSTGDAARTTNRALAEVGRLRQETPTKSGLGDLFAGALSAYGTYGKGRTAGEIEGIYNRPSITARANSGPSARVVS